MFELTSNGSVCRRRVWFRRVSRRRDHVNDERREKNYDSDGGDGKRVRKFGAPA